MAKEKGEEAEVLILVEATANGFYGGLPREAGDQFRVPKAKSKASWFKPVGDKAVVTKPRRGGVNPEDVNRGVVDKHDGTPPAQATNSDKGDTTGDGRVGAEDEAGAADLT